LFFGISFQQTTVGHIVWPVALFLRHLVSPMTWLHQRVPMRLSMVRARLKVIVLFVFL